MPLLKALKVYIRETPGHYVGRGAVPAGELTFEIWIEKAGEAYRWFFRGVQRGLINTLGRQFFEGLASRLVERIVRIDIYHHAMVFVFWVFISLCSTPRRGRRGGWLVHGAICCR